MMHRDEIDQWSCYQEESCIRKDQVCDNHNDCSNGEDEQNCPGTCFNFSGTKNLLFKLRIQCRKNYIKNFNNAKFIFETDKDTCI